MPAFKISRSPKSRSNERLPRQLGESHFGRYSCPRSKAPEARSAEVTRDCHVNRRKSLREIFMPAFKSSRSPKSRSNERLPRQPGESHFGRYSCSRSKSPEARSPEVTRGCHVNREKVTSGDFHPNTKSEEPKSRSDVRLPRRFRPYHSDSGVGRRINFSRGR
jgi:hypothetical protein